MWSDVQVCFLNPCITRNLNVMKQHTCRLYSKVLVFHICHIIIVHLLCVFSYILFVYYIVLACTYATMFLLAAIVLVCIIK